MKGITDNQLLKELQRRGWYKVKDVPFVVGCCGKGRKVELTYNPWDINRSEDKTL